MTELNPGDAILVVPRKGPFEARRVPRVNEFLTNNPENDWVKSLKELADWCGGRYVATYIRLSDYPASPGEKAEPGDWIVRWAKDEFKVLTNTEFMFGYELLGQHDYKLEQ